MTNRGKLSSEKLEWQRCPICTGSGAVWDLPLFPTRTRQCHACHGSGMVVRPTLDAIGFPIKGTTDAT